MYSFTPDYASRQTYLHNTYIQTYQQYLKDNDFKAAIRKIGSQFGSGEFTSNTGQSYEDYYGGWYDKAFKGKK